MQRFKSATDLLRPQKKKRKKKKKQDVAEGETYGVYKA